MKAYALSFVLVVTSMLAVNAHAQIVRDLTPEQIREAIALGTKSKEIWPYRIQEKARWSWPPLIAVYTTPVLRVALGANAAKKRYQAFTEKDVTPEMTAPEIQVFAPSQSLESAAIANVVTIVLLPHNSKDSSQAIHPTRIIEASQEYKNLLGFTGEGRGLVAVFPIDVWTENNEVHVVFDTGIPSSQGRGKLGGCTDCKSRIYLDKIR